MPNAPRFQSDACLLRRGMTTIFTHLGKFQPAKWGIFNRRKLGNFQPTLTPIGWLINGKGSLSRPGNAVLLESGDAFKEVLALYPTFCK